MIGSSTVGVLSRVYGKIVSEENQEYLNYLSLVILLDFPEFEDLRNLTPVDKV